MCWAYVIAWESSADSAFDRLRPIKHPEAWVQEVETGRPVMSESIASASSFWVGVSRENPMPCWSSIRP